MKATQQKSPTTPNVKPVNKDNRCNDPSTVHKEKENTSNSEIKEQVYEKDNRNEGDSSNKIENQRAIEKYDNQESDTPASSVKNAENYQENDLVHQDIQRLKG